MEGQECFNGGYLIEGTTQLMPEKKGRSGGDNFIVEELLDFNDAENDDVWMAFSEEGGSEDNGGNFSADSGANSSPAGGSGDRFSEELVCLGLNDAGISGDLCEPHEELAELQWLSNFVEQSFSGEDIEKQDIVFDSQSGHTNSSAAGDHPPPAFIGDAFIPRKARSKRSRKKSGQMYIETIPGKRRGKKKEELAMPGDRACMHCGSEKTPQWRTGPMGPKTLCNACGVRHKSGRLVPEYRPAASPTFVFSEHSNSHRKVLLLRRLKGMIIHHSDQFLPVSVSAAGTMNPDDFFR